jgi:hypothetical protein
MSPSPYGRVRRQLAVVASTAVLIVAAGAVWPPPVSAHSPTTVVHAVAGAARIGVLGDSSLAGVRWYGDFGALDSYSFVFDAESCRRTVETSCWSREGYRPENGLRTMQRLSGQWGDVLVVMTGYNDPGYGFDEAVQAVVDEARRQQIGHVLWLTLRTGGITYEEPLHQANARTYRESNSLLISLAGKSGGYLQVADWATYSADHDRWFEADGVHLRGTEGARGLMGYVADQVQRVLRGESVTPPEAPWYTLARGDTGEAVIQVQEALVAAGIELPGGSDGVFGAATVDAVQIFQHEKGMDMTGVVDRATAVALGLRQAPADAGGTRSAAGPRTGSAPAFASVSTPAADSASSGGDPWTLPWLLLAGFGGLVAWSVRARARYQRTRH